MTPDYERSARMAYKTLLALGIDSFPVDPLMVLSYCKHTAVHTYDEIIPMFGVSDPAYFRWYVMGDKDAITFRRDMDNGKIIYEMVYDSRVRPSRLRFTLAHELGHIILKHRQETVVQEREADTFAAHLLAPRPVFDLLSGFGAPMNDPSAVAEIFGLSMSASEVTIRDTFRSHDAELTESVRKLFTPWIEHRFQHISQFEAG